MVALRAGSVSVLEAAEPGWIRASDLGLVAGEEVVVRPGSPIAGAIANAIQEASALVDDDNENGVVDDGEEELMRGRGRQE